MGTMLTAPTYPTNDRITPPSFAPEKKPKGKTRNDYQPASSNCYGIRHLESGSRGSK